MPLPPVKSNVPIPVPVQPPIGGAQGAVNNALEAAAETAKLDALTREELSTLADRARTSFAALAAFTGREIGNALALKDGAFDWKEGDAVASAMLRLDDAIALAKRYKDEGKVVSVEDFEKREVQSRILRNELLRPTSPIKPMDNGFDIKKSETALAKEINQECRFQIQGLFFGDLFCHVCRLGWFK